MRNSVLRMLRIFLTSGAKLAALLLAVSVISFALVSASPVDPVQQYLLSLGTAVSPEQRAAISANSLSSSAPARSLSLRCSSKNRSSADGVSRSGEDSATETAWFAAAKSLK